MQRTFSQTGHRATCLSCWQQTGTPLMSQTDTCGTFSPVVFVLVLCVSEKDLQIVAGAESELDRKSISVQAEDVARICSSCKWSNRWWG